jgi:cytochrome c2
LTEELMDEPVVEPTVEPVDEPIKEPRDEPAAVVTPTPEPPAGDAGAGADVFRVNCLACHHAESENRKIGPGLAGLFERETLGRDRGPVTREAVRELMLDPPGTMPSFEGYLSDEELDDLVAYLETL